MDLQPKAVAGAVKETLHPAVPDSGGETAPVEQREDVVVDLPSIRAIMDER